MFVCVCVCVRGCACVSGGGLRVLGVCEIARIDAHRHIRMRVQFSLCLPHIVSLSCELAFLLLFAVSLCFSTVSLALSGSVWGGYD